MSLWQALDESEKKPFEIKARAFKDAYEFELEEYKQTPAYKQYEEAVAKAKGRGGDRGCGGVRGRGRGAKRKKSALDSDGDSDFLGEDDSDDLAAFGA